LLLIISRYKVVVQNQGGFISLCGADSIFMVHNVSLIAHHYDIDLAEAQVIQARLSDNSVVSFSENL
jgi:cobalt-zinc-cadmium efflux system outer membrane protein